ncbi:MAG: thiamine diphosphokinase [Bacteroidetes bacterium]|nr:thiamine diphosphokinase [Bacteroidota bacterium]
MKQEITFQSSVVILANGLFPTHLVPLTLLKDTKIILCIDGGYNQATKYGIQPDYIFGDMDSIQIQKDEFKGEWIELPNQNKTDLEKTLDWCLVNEISEVVLLGATGLRDDMTLANHYILFDYFDKINLKMVTDHFTITCHRGHKSFNSSPGETLSLFAQRSGTVVSSTALHYPLDQFILDPSARAISNQSIGTTFSIDSSDPILVFKSHPID